MSDLLAVLELEAIDAQCYVGRNLDDGLPRLFGGQLLAQAIIAADSSVGSFDESRHIHSLHGYFMQSGTTQWPVVYDVEHMRDGKRFSLLRVIARQQDRTLLSCQLSFQTDDAGLEHQIAMPSDVARPETLATTRELSAQHGERIAPELKLHWERERPFEIKPVATDHYLSREPLEPLQRLWFRATAPVPDSHAIRAAVLAYLSDIALLDTVTFAHGCAGFDADVHLTSLDHAMWFHRLVALDDWLLLAMDSPSAQASRGFARGAVFARDGALIASVAQEGLVRIARSR